MAKRLEPNTRDKPSKFEYTFEDDESISIWKYDKNKFPNGPISVEYKWKVAFTNRTETRKGSKKSKN